LHRLFFIYFTFFVFAFKSGNLYKRIREQTWQIIITAIFKNPNTRPIDNKAFKQSQINKYKLSADSPLFNIDFHHQTFNFNNKTPE